MTLWLNLNLLFFILDFFFPDSFHLMAYINPLCFRHLQQLLLLCHLQKQLKSISGVWGASWDDLVLEHNIFEEHRLIVSYHNHLIPVRDWENNMSFLKIKVISIRHIRSSVKTDQLKSWARLRNNSLSFEVPRSRAKRSSCDSDTPVAVSGHKGSFVEFRGVYLW